MLKEEPLSIKDSHVEHTIAATNYQATVAFRDRHNVVTVLRAPKWRKNPGEAMVTPSDFIALPYFHPENREDAKPETSREVAEKELEKLRQGDNPLRMGIELEASLYSKDGQTLIPTYDGGKYTAEKDKHPEATASMLEVATDKLPNGKYPATALEVVQSLVVAVNEGVQHAEDKNGLFVVASVPEAGSNSQIKLTEHPYISYFRPPPVKNTPWVGEIPKEAMDIYAKTKIVYLLAFQATHIHTSNPTVLDSDSFDPRVAYAKGQLRHTQFEKTLNFMLYNTTHYLGEDIGVKDVRAIARRGASGTHDGTIPDSAYEFFEKAQAAVEAGEIHSFSRYPKKGQHGVVRIKEFGTTEGVDGAANPDLRIILAKAFADQMRDTLAYEAMVATNGDETKVLPYLQKTYGSLFETIPFLKGSHSSFQQDLLFNREGFAGGINGISYKDQMEKIRKIIRDIGKKYPIFETQAIIVNHVLQKISQTPSDRYNLKDYLDHTTGVKPGIVTDYKSPAPAENCIVQAEATKTQAEALGKLRNAEDLLEFFGISQREKIIYKN